MSSQSSGVSCPLVTVLARTCTRCGRVTEPGNVQNICQLCREGGSRPGAAIVVAGPSTETSSRFETAPTDTFDGDGQVNDHCTLPTVTCTACRSTLRVPSCYQTAHILCPPCQARHAAVIKPDTVVHRANPYPVVMPIPKTTTHALALTVAFTYPQCPEPPPPSVPVGAVADGVAHHGDNVLRVCVRFGCGARLPARVLGDMCSACARVRPPPTIVQKRVPRRTTERSSHRPRESLDVVRALLSRDAAQDAVTTMERKDIEDECEVDLMYPDDIPAATHCASTALESKAEESNATEDEDAELNLVYPEDAVDDMCVSLSKPQTKVSQPITLRDLFRDGLHTLPALQDLTALVDKNPPRHCRMPGCNEVLPAQTNMERCVGCSIGDWKRRRLSSMDALDPLRQPSTSMEEKEVTAMLDDMSDVEDENDSTPPSSFPSKGSSNEPTADHGVRPIPGWDSDLTEPSSSDSDTESISDSNSESKLELSWPDRNATGLRIRIPLLVTRLPPGSLLQKCGNKRCNIALPRDHRWKTCDPCRRAQRMRFENIRRNMMGLKMLRSSDLACRRWRSLSPEMYETDTTLTPEISRPCSARGCQSRIPLPEVYRWKTCVGCRARARRKGRRKRDALLETQDASYPPEVVPRFPAYQNQEALLSSFDVQLKGFVEGQIMGLSAKPHDSEGDRQHSWSPEHSPMVFIFVGEYSIVTGQRDDSEEDSNHSMSCNNPTDPETMRQEVSSIVLETERMLRAKFGAGEAFPIDEGGIIMRFTCSLELIVQLRNTSNEDKVRSLTLSPPPNLPSVPLVKTLSGELEAVVVPDESHRLFHGRRMVVRYHMVG